MAARDEFGVKPLYWWSDGRRVALASEIGALLDAGLAQPEVDRVALDHYLACRFVPAPRTLFKGIQKLPAASTLIAEEGSAPRIQTWRAPPGEPHRDLSDDALAAHLAERFADAVERQMMSDVPYGAFLSGGVDSAAVVAAMAKRGGGRPPTTFTIGFPGHGGLLDERGPAAESARLIGTTHHDTAMRETDFLAELATAMPRLEEPCGIPSAPALAQLSRFAAEQVKVVLAGQGADEPHGGYGRHQAAALLAPLRLAPAALASPAAAVARALPRAARARRAAHLLGGRGDAERLLRLVEITDAPVRAALLGRSDGTEARAERHQRAGAVLGDVRGRSLLEQALYLDTRMFLPDGILLCNDKMSMAAGLELRVPFLDVELMRFVERIPARARVRPRAGKRLHRMAMERLLPPGISKRPKHGFSTPYDDWLRASLGTRGRAPLRAGRPARRPGRAEGGARARGRAPQRALRPQVGALLPARAVAVAPRLRRGGRDRGGVKRILYVHSRKASFVAIDREILAERFEIEDLYQPGRVPNPLKLIGGVLRADLVFGWFASWHTFFPITLAWLLRKPSVLVMGGFDTANMPDIGYGHQQGGLRMHASRWIFRRAGRLITNSRYSLSEIERNTPVPPARVTVVHHGVPDPFGEPPGEKERAALTVGAIDAGTLVQKGQLPFVRAAGRLPDVRFVFAGKWIDDAVERLRAEAPANVEFTGWLSDEALLDVYRRSAVYVQASRHEGFGLAVAEAMLAGCVPVVMNVTAMPEVVGEAGVLIESQEPDAVAAGITRALELGPDAARRARERILTSFPMESRRTGILRVVEEALAERG